MFAVTELREAIFTHLPCRSLLLAQRVSKTWQATIQRSLVLQKALCYKSTSHDSIQGTSIPNMCLRPRVPAMMAGTTALQFCRQATKPDAYIINPLLGQLCTYLSTTSPWHGLDGIERKIGEYDQLAEAFALDPKEPPP